MKRVLITLAFNNYQVLGRLNYALKDQWNIFWHFWKAGYDTFAIPETARSHQVIERIEKHAENLQPGDMIIIHIAGHGVYIDGKDCIACLAAGKTPLPRGDCFYLTDLLDRIKTKDLHVVVLLDVCRTPIAYKERGTDQSESSDNGETRARSFGVMEAPPASESDHMKLQAVSPKGGSLESDKLKGGIFSKAVCNVLTHFLKNHAEVDHTQFISHLENEIEILRAKYISTEQITLHKQVWNDESKRTILPTKRRRCTPKAHRLPGLILTRPKLALTFLALTCLSILAMAVTMLAPTKAGNTPTSAVSSIAHSNRIPEQPLQPPSESNRPIQSGTRHIVTLRSAFTNSLGMRFTNIGISNMLMSVWLVRVQDFEQFVKATGHTVSGPVFALSPDGHSISATNDWRNPGFKQGPTHPVVLVNWNDANAFCAWLTHVEQQLSILGINERYRLATHEEWINAINSEDLDADDNPIIRLRQVSANIAGEEASPLPHIEGYNDGYSRTSPVDAFPPNSKGLYDYLGNVWSWSHSLYEDNINQFHSRTVARMSNDHRDFRVLFGGSWSGHTAVHISPSFRDAARQNESFTDVGFRIVVARDNTDTQQRATSTTPSL